MSEELLTAADVAKKLGNVSASWVKRMTAAEGWPCVKFTAKTIRYRAEHVDAIVALYDHKATAAKGLAGQTAASRRRAS